METIREYLTKIFVFCAPRFNYNKINFQSKNLIFIDRNDDAGNYIPCLFIQEYEQSSKFLIYFHGNADDIFTSELFGQHLSENLKMNVIIVEYPDYSIYKSEKKNEDIIFQDSLKVYSFIQEKFEAKDEDIYILGRSLGTGPAVYLASEKKTKGLILISPFKSIKSIKIAFLSFFLLDIFKSIDLIGKITSPILFIHGLNDPLIDYSHSEELYLKTRVENDNKLIILNPEMTHNDFDVEKDIFEKIIKFLKDKPDSFPKHTFNLDDSKFKDLFDIPFSVQKMLFKLNIETCNPTNFEIEAKCALLLKDGRIAFGMNNSKVYIYNIDWCLNEKEIIIKTDNNEPINYMIQLKNKNLVICDSINVYFYSIGKFKYKLLHTINENAKVKKAEQINENTIIILFEDSFKIFNEKYIKIYEKAKKYKDLITSPTRIFVSTSDLIEIYDINGDELINNKIIKFKTIDTIYSFIELDNMVVALGEKEYLIYDKKNNKKYNNHQIDNPSHIWKVDSNSFFIWNKNGKIIYFEYNNNIFSNYLIFSIYSKNINSIIKLTDGSLIIAKNPIEKKGQSKPKDNLDIKAGDTALLDSQLKNQNPDCEIF